MSALLYIPPNATAQTRPGILAVHGYINSRETQDGFAIEFARRGYVVLALDQTGHGYSDPPGLCQWLSAAPMGWRICAASTSSTNTNSVSRPLHGRLDRFGAPQPRCRTTNKSMVLEGSSPASVRRRGTPGWPRNVALVFAQYEESPT